MQQEMQTPQIEIELDVQLKADKDGELKTELLSKLEEEYRIVKNNLNKGCHPDDYSLYEGLLGAIETAKAVVTEVWDRLHRTERE